MTRMSFIRYTIKRKKVRQIQIQPTTYMVKNRNKDNRGQQRPGCPSQGAKLSKEKRLRQVKYKIQHSWSKTKIILHSKDWPANIPSVVKALSFTRCFRLLHPFSFFTSAVIQKKTFFHDCDTNLDPLSPYISKFEELNLPRPDLLHMSKKITHKFLRLCCS